jgi:hypothetical protein
MSAYDRHSLALKGNNVARSRPFGITVLAALAGLGTLFAAINTLQYLHILPVSLGGYAFFNLDLPAALLWGVTTIAYAWITSMLWNVDKAAWLLLVLLSGLNLIFDVFSAIGGTAWSALLPGIVVNAVILLYCLWPRTREAFARA